MPTYDYACDSCGHALEIFQRMVEDPMTVCPECEEPTLKRKIGAGAGIIFKGGGFYETDFKEKKGSRDSGTKTTASNKAKEKSDSSPKETKKPESKESPSKSPS